MRKQRVHVGEWPVADPNSQRCEVCFLMVTRTGPLKLVTAVFVKGFGCRPHEGRRRVFGGWRPKASKGGNRA